MTLEERLKMFDLVHGLNDRVLYLAENDKAKFVHAQEKLGMELKLRLVMESRHMFVISYDGKFVRYMIAHTKWEAIERIAHQFEDRSKICARKFDNVLIVY